MNELEAFYSDLDDGCTCADMGSFSSFLSDLNEIPSLVEDKKNACEGKYGGIRRVLRCFADLPKELITRKRRLNLWILPCFLARVWKFVGGKSKLKYGELSNSQKQVVITLVEKKERTKDK